MVSLVNSPTNATLTRRWHVWEIELRFAPGLPPGWVPMNTPKTLYLRITFCTHHSSVRTTTHQRVSVVSLITRSIHPRGTGYTIDSTSWYSSRGTFIFGAQVIRPSPTCRFYNVVLAFYRRIQYFTGPYNLGQA